MEQGYIDLHKVPITALTSNAKNLLSCLLNTPKVLFSDTTKLPRDWRGIASLVKISVEIANSFDAKEKTVKVLQYWSESRGDEATVGNMLKFMQEIDRFDVFDDLMELMDKGNLVIVGTIPPRPLEVAIPEHNKDIVTFDDKIHGAPQFYHAYVLYATQDQQFVDEMLRRMREKGLKLCTEDDLLPNFQTKFSPVSDLISSDRCHRTILVYSPDFVASPAEIFFTGFAQAVGIETKTPKILPVMYRPCNLPNHLTYFHKLYYDHEHSDKKPSYDFWTRLYSSLTVQQPRLNGMTDGTSSSAFMSTHSTLNITEVTSGSQSRALVPVTSPRHPPSESSSEIHQSRALVPVTSPRHPHPPSESSSEIHHNDGENQDTASKSKKKNGIVKNIMNSFTLNKNKKKKHVLAVAN